MTTVTLMIKRRTGQGREVKKGLSQRRRLDRTKERPDKRSAVMEIDRCLSQRALEDVSHAEVSKKKKSPPSSKGKDDLAMTCDPINGSV